MIQHNLTLAWRQLVKYRLQSAVSVVSLAIGFACFALASMWIKYETTYDAFHKDADRMYVLMRSLNSRLTGYDWQVAYENCDSLVKYCPEVEAYTSFDHMDYQKVLQHDRQLTPNAKVISCDSTFLKMFNVQLVAGTWDFLHRDNHVLFVFLRQRKYQNRPTRLQKCQIDYCENAKNTPSRAYI